MQAVSTSAETLDLDVTVVGAGFSGLYLLKRLRDAGVSVRVFDAAADVGGTWYGNRYPGARCDIPSTDYTYSFDPELEQAWTWSEKYATQPEILEYLRFVADRYDLRPDITLETRVESAVWDEPSQRWLLQTGQGQQVRCRHYVMATGCLSVDVKTVLDFVASMELPTIESMPAPDARAFMDAVSATRPPGPDVAEVVDGVLPGAAGDLPYRRCRPAGSGPHPVVAYFHGGGWVLGSKESDEPFCRDLCVRSGAVVVSVDYRHAPEARFPAAADDAYAAAQWISAHAVELGGIPGELAVAGWSAGGNVATVACHRARDEGGPEIRGQLLLTPVVDSDQTRPSYVENGDGYVLTAPLLRWFWDHYCDEADRTDPRVAPLRGELRGLPPAIVVTAQFDPLRDEGSAYAQALEEAGVDVQHVVARGHTHTSLTMVDVVVSGAQVREEIAQRLRTLFDATTQVAVRGVAATVTR